MLRIIPKGSWITVNKKCNFRCKWCYAKGTKYSNKHNISLDLAKDIALLMKEVGIESIIIIGGEPTLWEPLLRFNKFCKDVGVKTTLVTNALRFSEDEFWEHYQESPNNQIGISLKAANPKQLFETTGSRFFKAMEIGASRASKMNGIISITYNVFYEDSLVNMVSFAKKCGSEIVKIDFCSTVFENGKPCNKYMVEPKKIVENILRDYPSLNEITGEKIVFEINIPLCLFPKDFINLLIERKQIMTVCHLLKRKGVIFDYNGNLIMCNALFDYPIGTYKKDFGNAQQLLDFLNLPKISKYYRQISHYPSHKCQQCEQYDICGGGCPLKWAIYKPEELLKIEGGEFIGVRNREFESIRN